MAGAICCVHSAAVLLCSACAVPQLFFKRSTLYIPFILVGAYFANEVRWGWALTPRAAARGSVPEQRTVSRSLRGPKYPHNAQRFLNHHIAQQQQLVNTRTPARLLLQGIDAVVTNVWEGRNAGKLFKHMTIPEQE